MTTTFFPFGKYKGYALDDIPSTYLAYALDEFDMTENLYKEVRYELVGRYITTEVGATPKEIYRRLSKKYHPDCGGTVEAMQAINDFYKSLLP